MPGSKNTNNNNSNNSETTKKRSSSFLTLIRRNYNSFSNLRDVSGDAAKKLSKKLDKMKKLLEDFGKKIQEMKEKQEQNPDEKNISSFINELKECLEKLKECFDAIEKKASKKEILEKTNELLLKIPSLINEIQDLNLEQLTGAIPGSVDELQTKISNKISATIKKALPNLSDDKNNWKKFKEKFISTDINDIEKFKKLTTTEQSLILIALEKMNQALCEAVLEADKIEIQFSLKENSIFQEIKLKLSLFPQKKSYIVEEPMEEPRVEYVEEESQRALEEWCIDISTAYQARMAVASFKSPEVYPYPQTRLRVRQENLAELESSLGHSEENPTWKDKLTEMYYKEAFEEAQSLIEEKKLHYANKNKKTNKSKHQKKIAVLNSIEDQLSPLSPSVQSVDSIKNIIIKTISPEIQKGSKTLSKVIVDLEGIYQNADARITKQIKRRELEIIRLQTKIDSIKTDNTFGTAVPTSFFEKELQDETNKFISKAISNCKKFVYGDSAKDSATKRKSKIDAIKEYWSQIETELKKAIDEDVYKKYFLLNENNNSLIVFGEIPNPSTWISELGYAYRSLQLSIAQLNQLSEKFKETQSQATIKYDSPQKHLAEMMKIVNQLQENVSIVAQLTMQLKQNPIIRANIKGIEEFSESLKTTIMTDIVHHPVVEFAKDNGVTLVKNMLSVDRLTYFTQELPDFYRFIIKSFPQDVETQTTVDEALKRIRELAKEADKKITKDEHLPPFEIIKFVLKNFNNIAKVLPDMGQVVNSLSTPSREYTLKSLQQLNLILRAMYLLLDRIETQFYLQEGYIANRIKVGDKSLHQFLEGLQDALNEAGYAFKIDEQFPYIEEILNQRQKLSQTSDVWNDEDAKQFFKKRIKSAEAKRPIEANNTLLREKEKIIFLIESRIQHLQAKRKNTFLLFANKRRNILEERILGLSYLRDQYQQQGATIPDVLYMQSASHLNLRNLLHKNDSQFILKMKKLDEKIPSEARGKIIIDFINSPIESNQVIDGADKIQTRIAKLKEERNNFLINLTTIKQSKIQLLGYLRAVIYADKLSYDDAIKKVRDKYPRRFHLLFEGRTGELMKELELRSLPKEKIVLRINAEIERLRDAKEKKHVFFNGSRKKLLDERISALNAFKDNGFDFDNLSNQQQALLRKHERQLVEDLNRWRLFSVNKPK